jgi:hypothetical protein
MVWVVETIKACWRDVDRLGGVSSRQETTILDSQWEQNGSSVGAGLNLTLSHPPQPRRERDPQPADGPRFSATAAR